MGRPWLAAAFAVGVVLLAPSHGLALPRGRRSVVTPTADTYVRGGGHGAHHERENYGHDPQLFVKKVPGQDFFFARLAFLSFDVSRAQLCADGGTTSSKTGRAIARASLELFVEDTSKSCTEFDEHACLAKKKCLPYCPPSCTGAEPQRCVEGMPIEVLRAGSFNESSLTWETATDIVQSRTGVSLGHRLRTAQFTGYDEEVVASTKVMARQLASFDVSRHVADLQAEVLLGKEESLQVGFVLRAKGQGGGRGGGGSTKFSSKEGKQRESGPPRLVIECS